MPINSHIAYGYFRSITAQLRSCWTDTVKPQMLTSWPLKIQVANPAFEESGNVHRA